MAWPETPLASAASCGEARSGRPTMVAAGALPSSLIMSQMMSVGGCWLPASITPMVSTNATRERSTTMAGAFLRSKLTMKSAMAWAGLIADAPASRAVPPAAPAPSAATPRARRRQHR